MKLGTTILGFAAIAAVGGAAAAQHPPVQTYTVQEKPSNAVVKTTLDAMTVPGGDYTVRSGDTLARIAGREYGSAGCWPGIYAANTRTVRNPDMIYPGQTLGIPAACGTRVASAVTVTDVVKPAPAARAQTDGEGYSIGSSFQACVIARESGGNADVWNASGHWGLYQFSAATWVAYGGAASEFGRASGAEQTRVFDNAMATPGGAGNWAPYDGC
jgi:LysM repeat protein